MPIRYDSSTGRFRDSKGRFVSRRRGLGSRYAREQYYRSQVYPQSKVSPKKVYNKIKQVDHKKIGTRDFVIEVYGVGNNVPSYSGSIRKAFSIYGKRTETSQFIVTAKKRGRVLTASSYSRFNDEMVDDWSEVLQDVFNRLIQSEGRIISVVIVFKKFV